MRLRCKEPHVLRETHPSPTWHKTGEVFEMIAALLTANQANDNDSVWEILKDLDLTDCATLIMGLLAYSTATTDFAAHLLDKPVEELLQQNAMAWKLRMEFGHP